MNQRYLTWLALTLGLLSCGSALIAQLPANSKNEEAPAIVPADSEQSPGTFFYSDLADPAAVPSAVTTTQPGSEPMEPNQNEPYQNTATTPSIQAPLAPTPDGDFPTTLPAAPTVRQSRFAPAPTPPTGTFFYSDLNTPSDITTPGNIAENTQETPPRYDLPAAPLPTTPLPGVIASPLYAIPPTTARTLNPPTTLQPLAPLPTPVIPSQAITTKSPPQSVPATEATLFNGNDQPARFTNYGSLILRQDTTASPNDAKQTPAQKAGSKWCRTLNLWGEFLYLRSRDSEVTYGVESNTSLAPPAPPVQVGRVGMVDQTADPGVRFGITYTLDESSSLTASWAMLESHRSDRIDRSSLSNVIESSVLHPSTAAASSSGTFATGIHDIDFDLVDLEYRGKLSSSETTETNYVVGLRYVYLQQEFLHENNILGNQTVATDIDFNGLGVRLGLEGERFRHKSRWFVYGKSYVNFVAGEFNAKFDQGQAFDASVVDTLWEAGRIVSIWDLELGLGHVCKSERLSISAGYSFSAWTNVVKTDEFINAVQTNNFLDLGETMTYDGLVARVEGRF